MNSTSRSASEVFEANSRVSRPKLSVQWIMGIAALRIYEVSIGDSTSHRLASYSKKGKPVEYNILRRCSLRKTQFSSYDTKAKVPPSKITRMPSRIPMPRVTTNGQYWHIDLAPASHVTTLGVNTNVMVSTFEASG